MSFGWLGAFRQGSWQSFRTFILRERRDITRRISVIDAEILRIGRIVVGYRRTSDPITGEITATEERVSFTVSRGSSLERLLQAYIALGGNPLDISHFFEPDRSVLISEDADGTPRMAEQYPYGGVVYPLSAEPNEPVGIYGVHPGGFLSLRKYPPWRMGGRRELGTKMEPFVNYIHYARRWTQQEIRYKRNDLEARIVKLCDLREQLQKERDDILNQAFGGLISSVLSFNEDRFAKGLRVPSIVDLIDSLFYERDENGILDFDQENTTELSKHDNLWEDELPDERNTAL